MLLESFDQQPLQCQCEVTSVWKCDVSNFYVYECISLQMCSEVENRTELLTGINQ